MRGKGGGEGEEERRGGEKEGRRGGEEGRRGVGVACSEETLVYNVTMSHPK